MTLRSAIVALALVSLALAALAAGLDLHSVESHTIVVYTTPAIKDYLEDSAIPAFTRQTGVEVVPVYLSAAEEYYRVRLSRDRPEADLFVHASPLYLEKGYLEGVIEPYQPERDFSFGNQSRPVPGGRIWQAFAWSPLVEVFRPGDGPIDLAHDDSPFGFAHPLLSNNGIYNVLFFESINGSIGRSALARTVVQPVNSATTIQGVADGSYDLTLGYEAVVQVYQQKGAKVEYAIPVVDGEDLTTPALFAAGLIRNHPHPMAREFMDFLVGPDGQGLLAKYGLHPMQDGAAQPKGVPTDGARFIRFEWSRFSELEDALARYEVNR